jgi:hypothetical protein
MQIATPVFQLRPGLQGDFRSGWQADTFSS